MNGVKWHKKSLCIAPGGFVWRAYVGSWYVGTAYNDGVSVVDGDAIEHGSIRLAALRVQRAAEAYAKKEGSL